MIITSGDVGHIKAIYVKGEASKVINGMPIRITDVSDEVVVGYTQVRVLATKGTANDMSLEPMPLEFSKKNGHDCHGNDVGPGCYMLAKATVDKDEVRISQGSISCIMAPKVSSASRAGMPYLNEQVNMECLNTNYSQPAWEVSKSVARIEKLI